MVIGRNFLDILAMRASNALAKMAYLRLRSAKAGASGTVNLIDFFRSTALAVDDASWLGADFEADGFDFVSLYYCSLDIPLLSFATGA